MSLFNFMITLAISSTAIGLIMLACASIMPRARNWPLFWSVGLIAGVATAILAAILSMFSFLMPQFHVPSFQFHEPFTSVSWPSLMETENRQVSKLFHLPLISTALSFVYLAGVGLSLFRLGFGRYRAAKIAQDSVKIKLADGTTIGLTREKLACITVTPLGRPGKSKIIISKPFRDALTDAELRNIIEHEKGHIRRRDDEVGVLLRVLTALSWFNPLSHKLFDRWRLSAEFQCDQLAIKGHSPQMRRAYAKTLLTALHIPANRVQQYPAASLSTHRIRNEKMRIKYIMQGSTPIFKHVGHKLLLLASALSLSLTSAVVIAANASAKTPTHAQTSTTENSFHLDGTLTSSYGKTPHPFKKDATRNHFGVDFKAPAGTPIYAPADGVIIEATALFNNNANYGKVVVFQRNDGLQTLLAHLNSYAVQPGQRISKGQKIAEIGNTGKSTGPHVHIETRRNGERVDPMSVWQFNN